MPIKSSPFFNNPEFAQAASNLSNLFAPPSGQDANGWAEANAKNAQASRLSQLFTDGKTPSERAALIGVQNYGQTPQGFTYQIDQDTASKKYGYDTAATTSRANNQADNVQKNQANHEDDIVKIVLSGNQPLSQGQTLPGIDQDILHAAGFNDMPAIPAAAGAPKPLSETEQNAITLRTLPVDQQQAVAFGSTPTENVVGPGGKTSIVTRLAAVNSGATPATKADVHYGQAAIGGKLIPVFSDGVSWKTQDGTPIPADAQVTNLATPQGDNTAVGVGPKTTEAQDRNAYAGTMAEGAINDVLATFENPARLPSTSDFVANAAKDALPNIVKPMLNGQISGPAQEFYQNIRTALPLQLMVQSGQAVTEQEYQRKLQELVPVPGEDPAVTASKRRQFATYLQAVKGIAGPAWDKTHPAAPAGAVPGTAPADNRLAPDTPVAVAPTATVKRFKFDANGNEVE